MPRTTLPKALSVLCLGVSLALGPTVAPAARAAGEPGSSAATPIEVTTLPFREQGRLITDDNNGPATDPASVQVSQTCGTGGPVYAATWWRVTPTTETVIAVQSAHNNGGNIHPYQANLGAVLAADGTTILQCLRHFTPWLNDIGHAGPITARPDAPVYVLTLEQGAGAFGATALEINPSSGVVPSNDTYDHPLVIPAALPYDTTQDTTLATGPESITGNEPPPLLGCYTKWGFGPAVWYSWTAPRTDLVDLSLEGSSYPTGMIITPSDYQTENDALCALDTSRGRLSARAGITYLIGIYGENWLPDSGMLRIRMDWVPPLATVGLTVDPVAVVAKKTGVVTLTGTLSCQGEQIYQPVSGFKVTGTLTQTTRRAIGTSSYTSSAVFGCSATPQRWTATVTPTTLMYAAGAATVTAQVTVCNTRGCRTETTNATIRLKN